jgi:hypothetical protein
MPDIDHVGVTHVETFNLTITSSEFELIAQRRISHSYQRGTMSQFNG